MKRITAFICAAALAAGMCSVPAGAEEGKNLLVLGDSITSGYGLPGYVSGDNYSAPDSFANKLSDSFAVTNNLAVDGRTSGELLEKLREDEEYRENVASADTIVISIGGNDMLMPMIKAYTSGDSFDMQKLMAVVNGEVSPEELMAEAAEQIEELVEKAVENIDLDVTADNINAIADEIRSLSDAQIFILTVYDPMEGMDMEGMEIMGETTGNLIHELDGIIEAAADSHEEMYAVDVYSAFKGQGVLYTNIASMDVHPNKAGHEYIYRLLKETMANNPPAEKTKEVPAPEAVPAAAETVTEAAPEAPAETVPAAPADSDSSAPPTGNAGAGVFAAAIGLSLVCAFVSRKK